MGPTYPPPTINVRYADAMKGTILFYGTATPGITVSLSGDYYSGNAVAAADGSYAISVPGNTEWPLSGTEKANTPGNIVPASVGVDHGSMPLISNFQVEQASDGTDYWTFTGIAGDGNFPPGTITITLSGTPKFLGSGINVPCRPDGSFEYVALLDGITDGTSPDNGNVYASFVDGWGKTSNKPVVPILQGAVPPPPPDPGNI